MSKESRWTYTSWKRPTWRKPDLIYFEVFQREKTESGKIHYQGYVEFKSPYTMRQVKSIAGDKTIHIEEARSSRERNMMYCLKPETYHGERYMYNGPADTYHGVNSLYFESNSFDQIIDELNGNMDCLINDTD